MLISVLPSLTRTPEGCTAPRKWVPVMGEQTIGGTQDGFLQLRESDGFVGGKLVGEGTRTAA